MKKFWILALCAVLCWGMTAVPSHAALTPGATYAITIQKVNSNGTVSDVSTSETTADANGKLSFSLTSMPTNAECNFIVFIVKDANQAVQRKGFVPAPPAGSTNLVGVNSLSTVQTNAVIAALELAGTDDPIAVAYLLVLLRSPEATENDATTLAALGKEAIMGNDGFEGFLTANGVTTTQMNTFKSRLIYNPTSGKKTIAYLMAQFKEAIDNATTTEQANQILQKAGGYMADVFMDAAEAAGIDFMLILAAHDAAGEVSQNAENTARMLSLSSGVRKSIEQAMSSFFMRIASIKVKNAYTKALTTLGASGNQVTRFLDAVQTMMAANEAIDATYGEYFMNPDSYLASHPGATQESVRQAIDAAFNAAFLAFQADIQGSNADIAAMRTNVVTAFKTQDPNFDDQFLPGDFGTYRDFTGQVKNWPIPQVVMVNWLADLILAGGALTYTQDTVANTPVPDDMASWMGRCRHPLNPNQVDCQALPQPPWVWANDSCLNPTFWDQTGCQGSGATWIPGRRVYTDTVPSPSPSFNYYMALMDDINMIEFNRYGIYKQGPPTREQERQAKLLFQQRMEAAADRITGTTNGTTDISDAQKDAIIKLLMQPSMN